MTRANRGAVCELQLHDLASRLVAAAVEGQQRSSLLPPSGAGVGSPVTKHPVRQVL